MPPSLDPSGSRPTETQRPGGQMRSAAADAPTRSQLFPFGSELQEVIAKPYFLPGVIAALALACMWAFIGDPRAVWTITFRGLPVGLPLFLVVLASCLSLGGAFALYRMAGKPKAWWVMPLAALATAILCLTPVMAWLQAVFNVSGDETRSDPVAVVFFKMFFTAGLPEECLKAIPVALGVWIGARWLRERRTADPLRQLAVLEPLDGIILGAAAGFGFAFSETLLLYVPRLMVADPGVLLALMVKAKAFGARYDDLRNLSLVPAIQTVYLALIQAIGPDHAAVELQKVLRDRQSAGLMLMIPRLFSNLFGHAAYAGVFGYFIGLAAMHPGRRLQTVLTGLAIAATLHALWNSLATVSPVLGFAVAVLAFFALSVCIARARRISPQRSQLVASQILDRFARPAAVAPAATAHAPAPQPQPAAPLPASVTWDDDSQMRTLELGSLRLPATLGAKLYEGHVPGIRSGRGDTVVGEIAAHPSDPSVLGLKNLSDRVWFFTAPAKAERELAPGRSIRLEAGMQLRIGSVVAHVR